METEPWQAGHPTWQPPVQPGKAWKWGNPHSTETARCPSSSRFRPHLHCIEAYKRASQDWDESRRRPLRQLEWWGNEPKKQYGILQVSSIHKKTFDGQWFRPISAY